MPAPYCCKAKIQFLLEGTFNFLAKIKIWAVVVAQLAARSLPIPEDPGSNPVIGNFY